MSEKTGSRIFYPYKVVGLVCGKRRLRPNYLGNEVFLNVPLGKNFIVYSAQKLRSIMSSTQLTQDITAIEVYREFTFAAVGKDIVKFRRFTVEGTMKGEFGNLVTILGIGDYLITTSEDGYMCVWNHTTLELIRTINLGRDFHPSFVMHPNTYLNKVLVGSASGKLQLWNIRSGSLIMDFKGYNSAISYIEQSPSVDVVAIGLANGEIDVLNLKYDESVMHFQQASCVTSLSFFTNMSKAPLMLSAGADGHICIWDIKQRRLHFESEDAHTAPVHSAFFLPESYRFISAGEDNALKMWSVDEVDHSPRLVFARQGHTDSSSIIRFYGYNSVLSRDDTTDGLGMNLLSAGMDCAFRNFNLMQETISTELSQGSNAKRLKSARPETAFKRLPTIVDFAYSEGRERAWSNILTCHDKYHVVIGWKFMDHVKTNLRLKLPKENREKENYALCCAVGNNGETSVVGYRDGQIAIYNMQSGMYRGSLPREAKKGFTVKQNLFGYLSTGQQEEGKGRHGDSILCVGIDMTNNLVVSVSRDKTIHFWDILERTLVHSIELDTMPSHASFSRTTGLLAVAFEDHTVSIFDSQTYNHIRRFRAVETPITALCMNEEGRWLFVADAAGDVRVYDIPNHRLIDWVHFDHPVLSLSISTNDEFIATSHRDELGIRIWANNCFYSDVLFSSLPRSPVFLDTAMSSIATPQMMETSEENDEESEEFSLPILKKGMDVMLSSAVTSNTLSLSHAPSTKWGTLSSLEQIRERNKPEEAPKAPEKAPFFLPTTSSLTPEFVAATEEKEEEKEERTTKRFVTRGDVLNVENDFQRLIRECATGKTKPLNSIEVEDEEDIRAAMGSFYPLLLHFRHSSVAAADSDLRLLCMGPLDSVGTSSLRQLFQFFRLAIHTQIDYEMIQALLDRTLQLYGDVISTMEDMREMLGEISREQEEGWKRIQGMMQQCLCMVELFSNVQL